MIQLAAHIWLIPLSGWFSVELRMLTIDWIDLHLWAMLPVKKPSRPVRLHLYLCSSWRKNCLRTPWKCPSQSSDYSASLRGGFAWKLSVNGILITHLSRSLPIHLSIDLFGGYMLLWGQFDKRHSGGWGNVDDTSSLCLMCLKSITVLRDANKERGRCTKAKKVHLQIAMTLLLCIHH